MTNKKSTKRALLVSAMAMVICFTMLLGTTFAWFTDSEVNTGNVVKSGTLNLEVTYASWENGTLSAFADAETGKIFNYQNWEPGYVDAKQLVINNTGSLDFNYKLQIVGTPSSDITDVIYVYYFKNGDAVTRDTLKTATPLGTLTAVLGTDFGASSLAALNAGDSDTETITIVFKMIDTAGNTYQNKTSGEFSVKVLATQKASESDSIGNDYDNNAEYGA